MLEALTRYWWIFVLRGMLAIAFGVLVLVWPRPSLVVLAILFGIFALADGTVSIAEMFRDDLHSKGVLAVRGVVGILAGLYALAWPGLTSIILLFVIAFWAIVVGALEAAAGLFPTKGEPHHWGLVVAGAVSIVFGIVVIAQPTLGALAVATVIGIWLIVRGGALVSMGINVHRLFGSASRPAAR